MRVLMLVEGADLDQPLTIPLVPDDEAFARERVQGGVDVVAVVGQGLRLDARGSVLEAPGAVGLAPKTLEEDAGERVELGELFVEEEPGLELSRAHGGAGGGLASAGQLLALARRRCRAAALHARELLLPLLVRELPRVDDGARVVPADVHHPAPVIGALAARDGPVLRARANLARQNGRAGGELLELLL